MYINILIKYCCLFFVCLLFFLYLWENSAGRFASNNRQANHFNKNIVTHFDVLPHKSILAKDVTSYCW